MPEANFIKAIVIYRRKDNLSHTLMTLLISVAAIRTDSALTQLETYKLSLSLD